MRSVEPPEQHPCSCVKPEAGPDELKLAQMDNRLEPRPCGETNGEPIEQHDAHEYKRPWALVSFIEEDLGMFTTPRRATLPIFTNYDSKPDTGTTLAIVAAAFSHGST